MVQPAGQRFGYELRFHASVLHMRGRDGKPTMQPFVGAETNDVLVWNGEVFDGLEVSGDAARGD